MIHKYNTKNNLSQESKLRNNLSQEFNANALDLLKKKCFSS